MVQNPPGMPGAAVLAATIAVAVLANGAICTAVHDALSELMNHEWTAP
jgi:hypothetical protein